MKFRKGYPRFTRQLDLFICNGRWFDSKDAMHWEGASEGVNRSTVNDAHCMSELSCVRSPIGELSYVIDVIKE